MANQTHEEVKAHDAIKEGNGVEDVSEVSQVRQEKDLAVWQIDAVRFRVSPNPFANWQAWIAEVIPIVETGPVPSVIAREGRHVQQVGYLIHIQKRHEERICKLMSRRSEPAVPKCSRVKRRLHTYHSIPKFRATRSAEFNPSS